MEAIKIRQTTEEDFEVIRNIRDDVNNGGDYLEDVYLEWINKPHISGYACEIDGTLVAFTFVLLIDGGQSILTRATRVDKQHEGKGLIRKLMQAVEEIYRNVPSVKYHIKAFNNTNNVMVQQITAGKPCLVRKKVHVYHFEAKHMRDQGFLSGSTPSVVPVTSDQLAAVFRSQEVSEWLFPEGRLVIDWELYRLMEENINHIVTPRSCLLASDISSETSRPSTLLTCGRYTACKMGLKYILNIYGTNFEKLSGHLVGHIKRCLQLQVAENTVVLMIHAAPTIPEETFDCLCMQYGLNRRPFVTSEMFGQEEPIKGK